MNTNHTLAALLATAALLPASANAATTPRTATASAPALCQPALPAYDGLIRKRPLAVQNEGTAPAFVSCAFIGDTYTTGTVSAFVYLINNNASAVTVSCTLVNSHAGGLMGSYPKSVSVPANNPGGTVSIEWTTADTGGSLFSRWVSLQCRLPAGTGIGHLGSNQDVEIGA